MPIAENYHAVAVGVIFGLTLILILTKPKGLDEAWATVVGAFLMLVLGLETPEQALQTVTQGRDVLIFLFALMLLSGLLDKATFFEWAAIKSAAAAKGNGQRLYRNVFLLGAVVTALLSLDTTAIILTPIVLSFVRRLELQSRPFLLACAFVSNTGSLLMPISNLTNLLFASAFQLQFATFTALMCLPQLVVICLNYYVFKLLFKKDLPDSFDVSKLPEAASIVKDKVFFRCALLVVSLVLVGYFVGATHNVPPFVIALAGALFLLIVGLARKQVGWSIGKEIGWALFPFVIGLFVIIRAVENLGLASTAVQAIHQAGDSAANQILITAFGAACGSNIVNNIPMSLLAISVIKQAHASTALIYGAMLGCNLGPNLTVAGSLATMLVITSARKRGETVGALDFFRAGLITTPILLLGASATLLLSITLLSKFIEN